MKKLWSRTASIFLVGACLVIVRTGIAQTVPAPVPSSTPSAALSSQGNAIPAAPVTPQVTPPITPQITPQITQADPQNSAQPSSAAGAKCAPGPAWLCVSQVMQRLMFNPDGTHRTDPEIAAAVPAAIADLIKDGVMKPENAPATPILTFDDANKFVTGYPIGAESPASTQAPPPRAAPPVKTEACPPDQPWLCPAQPGAPKVPSSSTGNTTSGNTSSGNTTSPRESTKSASSSPKGKPAAPPADAVGRPHRDAPQYVLGPNDVVAVSVFEEKMVPGTYAIGPDGRISMPLLGTFKAIDMTVDQLKDLLTARLRDEGGILDPIVNVQLLRSNSKQFTLAGGVGRTGPVPLTRDTTILDALTAVGFKEFAKTKKIILRRGTKEFPFNYPEVLKGKNLAQNIFIEDGDLIYVPE